MERGRALLAVFFFAFSLACLALAQPRLTVLTDSNFYEPGSELRVIVEGPAYAPAGIEVRGPGGELIALRQLTLDERGFATFVLLLDPESPEGTYTVYVATPGAFNVTKFTVVARPSPVILLIPPGQAEVGRRVEVPGFVYPGLPLKVRAYAKYMGGEWVYLGEFEANASGWFTVPLLPDVEGVYEVRVEFMGAHGYGPASSTGSFRAVKAVPQWRVEAPAVAWLGEVFVVNCSGCDEILARTVSGERRYKCGSRVALDVPGPWAFYPAVGDELGLPAVTLVKAKLDTRVESPVEVGVNEPFVLAAHLSIPVPALRVAIIDQNEATLAEALSRTNGVALARIALARAGEYRVTAVPQRTSVFEPGEMRPAMLKVLGERVYVRIVVVDAAGRLLPHSIVEVAGARYEAPKGYAEFAIRAGVYDVRVLWRDLTVFHGELGLEGGNMTLRTELYDLNVTVLDLLGRPVGGAVVELFNGTQRLAVGVTDSEGKLALIRVPPGLYSLKVEDASITVAVPQQTEVVLRLPPPLWLALLATLIALAVATVWAARRYVRISVREEEEG